MRDPSRALAELLLKDAAPHHNVRCDRRNILMLISLLIGLSCALLLSLVPRALGWVAQPDMISAHQLENLSEMTDVKSAEHPDTEMVTEEDTAMVTEDDTALEEPKVAPDQLSMLEGMGFSRNMAVRAIHGSKAEGIEQAIQWLEDHRSDADLDMPLLLPKQLTPEEARIKMEELRVKAKAKREEVEKQKPCEEETQQPCEVEKQQPCEVEAAVAAPVKTQEEPPMSDDAKRKSVMAAHRKREKQRDAERKERIVAKVRADQYERALLEGGAEKYESPEARQARMLKKAEDDKKAEEAAAEYAKISAQERELVEALKKDVRKILVDMKMHSRHDKRGRETCLQSLMSFTSHIMQHPDDESWRQIRKSSAAFQSQVARFPEAVEFLKRIGFQEDGEFLRMSREAAGEEGQLRAAVEYLDHALSNAWFGIFEGAVKPGEVTVPQAK
eukprot:gnl/TRDRNA2_/TRDRNA2_128675_c0_seq1.p1 gnl/TRDRNA2_/TRDRNA2_128675_c0~~gnl/TRDRNA2_/TRDRNA2_128675_c0_seq1.p1  ORF type:complete len:444 (+),score=111.63 gnl/TRDRNA2_/TRDRNA2_128675_c0_seq1:33-1364(+)